jgi:hypothetical protein
MCYVQAHYQEFTDQSRTPVPDVHSGGSVWLNTRNITTSQPSLKLNYKYLRLFTIRRVISSSPYKLELPKTMKCHPVFHISLFSTADDNPFPGQILPPPLPITVDGHKEWTIREILDSRIYYRKSLYLIAEDRFATPIWEPAEGLNEAAAVNLFHAHRPDKPGPFLAGSAHMEPRVSRGGYCHGPNHHPNPKGFVLEILEDDLVLWLRRE